MSEVAVVSKTPHAASLDWRPSQADGEPSILVVLPGRGTDRYGSQNLRVSAHCNLVQDVHGEVSCSPQVEQDVGFRVQSS